MFCAILHLPARMDAIFSTDALIFEAASAYTHFRGIMGSNVDFMQTVLKPKKMHICVVRPIHVGHKNGPGTSITPTDLHHILHGLLFIRKTRIPRPLGGPKGP